jgi:hypothetical protein
MTAYSPVAMPGELQITPFCVLQRMDAETSDAAHSGYVCADHQHVAYAS